jgi:hypothetical protein
LQLSAYLKFYHTQKPMNPHWCSPLTSIGQYSQTAVKVLYPLRLVWDWAHDPIQAKRWKQTLFRNLWEGILSFSGGNYYKATLCLPHWAWLKAQYSPIYC